MKFIGLKIYYIEVITKKYPTILEFGEVYKKWGFEIPTYCTEEDIKIITKEEYNEKSTKINLDREINQGGLYTALHRVKFCLDKVEEIEDPNSEEIIKIFNQKIGHRLTCEELLGALVAAEQVLNEIKEDQEKEVQKL